MGYVLLLGVWIGPRCNYAMLIPPPSMHLPWGNKVPQLFGCQWLSEVKYEWINVGLHTGTPRSSLQLWGIEGVKGSVGACCCVSRDGVGRRSGHLELLSWIYCVRGGRGQASLLLPPPQDKKFVSIGHETDAGSADESPLCFLRKNRLRSEVLC